MVQGERSYFGKNTESYKDSLCANGCNSRSIEGSVLCRKCFNSVKKYNEARIKQTLIDIKTRFDQKNKNILQYKKFKEVKNG